jgi:hypothetical protein
LNNLERIVQDKRNKKRADVKKNGQNRHYTKVLIRYQLKNGLTIDEAKNMVLLS